MCEVESIINNRPITSTSEDPNDLEPLTPNHLLLLKTQPSLPPGVFNKEDQYVRKCWRQVQYLTDLFWSRWTHEYLPILQERSKWSRLKRNFETGDVVLVVDSSSSPQFMDNGKSNSNHTRLQWNCTPCKVKDQNKCTGETCK